MAPVRSSVMSDKQRRILRDIRHVLPLAAHITTLVEQAERLISKYPGAYEKDILQHTHRLIKKAINESFGIFGKSEKDSENPEKETKHQFFERLLADIEDLNELGLKITSPLDSDMLEALWRAIPDDLNVRILVVRVVVEEKAVTGNKAKIQSTQEDIGEEYPE
jgi:hypothetical protein